MAVSRHELREKAMTCLYQHFLLNKDIKETVFENNDSNEIDPFLYTVTIDAIKYEEDYIQMINEALREDWTFERLGYVEKAILIMAACELDMEIAPKPIVINEAVTLAKKYCDEETYNLINGVLDRL